MKTTALPRRWQFLDSLLEVGQLYSVHRLAEEWRGRIKQE